MVFGVVFLPIINFTYFGAFTHNEVYTRGKKDRGDNQNKCR